MISGLNLVNLVAETCIYDYFSANVVFLFILKITAMFWADNATGEIIL